MRKSTTKSHNTSILCMKEIKKCLAMSLGPAFICLVGNKYGYGPFPALIDKYTLDSMWSYLCGHHVVYTPQLQKDLRDILVASRKRPVCDVNWDTTTCSRLEPLSFIPQCFRLVCVHNFLSSPTVFSCSCFFLFLFLFLIYCFKPKKSRMKTGILPNMCCKTPQC